MIINNTIVLEYDKWDNIEKTNAYEILSWIEENCHFLFIGNEKETESKECQMHYRSNPVIRHIKIFSKENMMAFKLRWL